MRDQIFISRPFLMKGFHMKKLTIFLFCLVLLLSACKPTPTDEPDPPEQGEQPAVSSGTPTAGFYEGTTDQDEDISIWVEDLNGTLTVTGFLYNITLQGDGWSSKVTYYQKIGCNLAVEGGKFLGYLDMNSPRDTVEVSGVFTSDTTIVGRLRHTSQHEQAQFGSATADIEFEAERTGALESATLPDPDSGPLEEEEPVTPEDNAVEEPVESVDVDSVVLSDDEVWFNSHPGGAEVYVVPLQVDLYDVELDDIIQPQNLVGNCPVVASMQPGNYYVVFKFSADLFQSEGLVLPLGSDPTFSESLPFDGNPIKQTTYGANDAVETISKLYSLTKKAGNAEALISLAVPVPEGERLASTPRLYPSMTAVGSLPIQYGFNESTMRDSIQRDLQEQNLTSAIGSDMIDEMIAVLLRVGKVKLDTDSIDIYIQMIGFSGNGWTVTIYS